MHDKDVKIAIFRGYRFRTMRHWRKRKHIRKVTVASPGTKIQPLKFYLVFETSERVEVLRPYCNRSCPNRVFSVKST